MAKSKLKSHFHTFWNMHLTSTISMSLVLFLIGLVCLLLFTGRDISNYVKENINLSIVLNSDIKTQDEQRIQNYLLKSPYAKTVTYISKEDALKDHIADLGEDPKVFLGFNPLLASVEVKLNALYANNDSVKVLESKLHTFEGIHKIIYQKDMVNMVNENIEKLSIVLFGITLILLIISIALINNTIRLSLHSSRFLINTMKLVGATAMFIRKPYLISNVLNGLVAAFLALVMLVAIVLFVNAEFGMPGELIKPFTGICVSFAVLLSGVFISLISAYSAVGKYLKMSSNDMFSI